MVPLLISSDIISDTLGVSSFSARASNRVLQGIFGIGIVTGLSSMAGFGILPSVPSWGGPLLCTNTFVVFVVAFEVGTDSRRVSKNQWTSLAWKGFQNTTLREHHAEESASDNEAFSPENIVSSDLEIKD
ncbi:hypothetical protein NDU88_002852 [Pleurodeles waltl]|uniref:Uncharacterized protein n=1 Tax=Pleurodeles waltl TaxID=8319 RepID=A0AAV7LF94_PLEWA|nr:hypothetical protein NDU88_002852 [Pleurodeles waltl]